MAFKIGDGFIEVTGRVDKNQLSRAGKDAGQSAGDAFGNEFWRSSDGRLRDGRGRFAAGMAATGASAGQAASSALVGQFGQSFKMIPPQLKAVLVGGVAFAAPFVGAAVSGALLAGLSSGVVAAGVAAAFQSPKVKAEASSLGAFLKGELLSAASSFIDPTIGSLRLVRREWGLVSADVRSMFAKASGYVMPLAQAMMQAARNVLPAISRGVERAQPVINMLTVMVPKLAADVGAAIDSMTRNGEGAAMGLGAAFTAVGSTIRFVGSAVGWLTDRFMSMVNIAYSMAEAFDFMPDWHPVGAAADKTKERIELLRASLEGGNQDAGAMDGAMKGLAGGLFGAGSAAGAAAPPFRTLLDLQQGGAEAARSQFDAETSLRQAIREATAAANANTAGIKGNSEAALDNRAKLSNLATQTVAATASQRALTGATGEAERTMQRGYNAFIKAARGMGVGRAEAHALAVQLGLIPTAKSTRFTAPGLPTVIANVKTLKAQMSTIDTYKEIQIIQRFSTRGVRVSGVTGAGGFTEKAAGGPLEGGVPNRDSIPVLGMPGEYMVPKWMVPVLGGVRALENIRQRGFVGAQPAPTGPRATGSVPAGAGNVTFQVNVDVASLRTIQDMIGFFRRLETAARTYRAPGQMVTA